MNAGAKPHDIEQFINKRVEMWWIMAGAVKNGIDMSVLSLEHFERLKDDLVNIEYFMQPTSQKYQLESVDDLKARELPSPDFGTALALSFAYPVPHVVQSSTSKFKKAETETRSTIQKKRGLSRGKNRR